VDRIAVIRYLDAEEAQRLDKALGNAGPWLRAFTLMALNTGARRGELWQLKWGDISKGMMTIHGKGAKSGQTRHIPLNQTALDALREWRGDVIPIPTMEVFGHKWLDKSWKTLMKRAQIENFTFHCTRHTFASRLVMKGVALNTVRDLMGHSSIEMTLRYAHLAPENLKSAVELIG